MIKVTIGWCDLADAAYAIQALKAMQAGEDTALQRQVLASALRKADVILADLSDAEVFAAIAGQAAPRPERKKGG